MKKPRGVLIAGNWKMNHGLSETNGFFDILSAQSKAALPKNAEGLLKSGALRALVIPTATSLQTARNRTEKNPFPLAIGAQNAHGEKSGAFTGEISGPMLQELNIRWVLIGHSERRQFFGETDSSVRKRCEGLLSQGFHVMLCVGETRAERERGETFKILERQLSGVFAEPEKGAATFLDGRLVLAYEPVWAIGTGLTATPEQAEEAHQMIRKWLWDHFGMDASGRTPILYGGSVTPQNIDSL
ncbi:MAG: triose-phosphate isomerase, partial [Bdellovibrionota bacterium]